MSCLSQGTPQRNPAGYDSSSVMSHAANIAAAAAPFVAAGGAAAGATEDGFLPGEGEGRGTPAPEPDSAPASAPEAPSALEAPSAPARARPEAGLGWWRRQSPIAGKASPEGARRRHA